LPGLLAQRAPGTGRVVVIARLVALVLLILGASGPQWGREAVRRTSQGSDVVFVIDVSASMESRDVVPSRLEEARHEAIALLPGLAGSRVGAVAFAGDAVRLCPLTLDPAAVRLTLETLGPGAVSEPGSDLGRALRMALRLMPAGRRDDQAVVLWTDGEDLEGHTREALQDLQRAGLRVFVVGVGTAAGDVIPVHDDAGVVVDVKRDEQGAVVRSRLDERLLRELARSTRGLYLPASRPGGELVRLTQALGSLAHGQRGTRLIERPVARFPLCALLAAIAIVWFLAVPRRRVVAAARVSPTVVRAAVIALLMLVGQKPTIAHAQSDWARGDAAYRRKDYVAAESSYARRAARGRVPAEVLANLAATRAQRAEGDTTVERALEGLAARPDAAGGMSSYNLGTLLGRRQSYDRALAALRGALERNPDDADARWNYEWVLRQQQEQQRRSSSSKPEPKPQPPQPQPQQGQGQRTPPRRRVSRVRPRRPRPAPVRAV
jgi:Ca-activated chloride channel family protein